MYTVDSLLSYQKDGTISGPMSPLLFAKEVFRMIETKFAFVSRISFQDHEMLQVYEGVGKTELTGLDHLLIAKKYKNCIWISLWIDNGVGGLNVAQMGFGIDTQPTITKAYREEKFEKRLTDDEISDILSQGFHNFDEWFKVHEYKSLAEAGK